MVVINQFNKRVSSMRSESLTEAESFYQFLTNHLSSGRSGKSPEELLKAWRCQQEHRNTVTAIQQGLTDVREGRTEPFEDFDQEFRAQYMMLRPE